MSDPNQITDRTRELLDTLIAFDTTSRNSNLDLIHTVRDYLKKEGVEAELVHDGDGAKANLYATIGPEDRGGVALSGHTDVVPVDGQDWSSDPWQVRQEDGRLYGRGTCDMKGFLAVALAFVPRFAEANLNLPVHLCLSYDEEVGCLGVHSLLARLKEKPVRPRMVIIGEPTDMTVVTGHKGKLSVRCTVKGKEAHSSLAPLGVNAINSAAEVVSRLAAIADRIGREGPFEDGYDVPHTTVHTGVIHGGTQLNIVPGQCTFDFEFRHLPRDDAEGLLAEVKSFAHEKVEAAMKKVAPDTGFSWKVISRFPGLDAGPDDEAVTLAKALTGSNTTGKVSFGTEGGLFSQSGMPAVVCGPGSIDQAHKPDEYVSLDQLGRCERFIERLLDRLTGARDA